MTLELLKKGTSENFLLRQLIKKNFTSKYKDSVLGILWSFLNPLIQMAILTAIVLKISQFTLWQEDVLLTFSMQVQNPQ